MADPRLSADQIRARFVEFFEGHGHRHVPSSSLVPQNDPTLLFTNAGMVQFKDVFTGRETRDYRRAVTVQRCLRAGGKHNDLDNVGFTPRHHTLFEMLGNFSFGDYFKAEAIRWAWEFLTEAVGLPAKRLVVTVYNGEGESAPADDEAAELWSQFVPPERIYRCSAKENFWMMGDTGPCGPNSEINVFHGDEAPPDAGKPGRGPEFEEDRYLELWNLVFMQYERKSDGSTVALPRPGVDTGAGLERIAATVAGVPSNYETDLLAPLVNEARRLAGAGSDAPVAPFRVIADHARATAFLIADGVFPDKKERQYVLRRIMRRAIRHGTEVGLDEPFFHRVCARVVQNFGGVYPELRERAAVIDQVVQTEEQAFRRTLGRGLRKLQVAIDGLRDESPDDKRFPPAAAAVLYDTYGFPIDLTGIIARERGYALDEKAATAEIEALQSGGSAGSGKLGHSEAIADHYFALHGELGDTEFTGYAQTTGKGRLRAIWADGLSVKSAGEGTAVEVVFDRTPFYAESGGQVGDAGQTRSDGATISVTETIKPVGGMHVHRGTVLSGTIDVGQTHELVVDAARRDAIRRNHSATHLLHHALREVLGEHVVQKGSLVAPDRLRFDFSHGKAVTDAQLRDVEFRVNAEVLRNTNSTTRQMPLDEAKRAGAMGLFGEKYGDEVRVVTIGNDSVELCGGTHVTRAGDIGLMTIVSEGGIAQGVRRIEALTGMGAVSHVQQLARAAREAAAALHAGSVAELGDRIGRLQTELRERDRQIADLQRRVATGGSSGGDDTVVEVDGVKLLARRVTAPDPKTLRAAADTLRDRLGSGVVVLGSESEGKATLLVAVTKDLKDRVHAGKLVGLLATHVDGRGGGRPDLAQAGGPTPAGLDAALTAAGPALEQQLRSAS